MRALHRQRLDYEILVGSLLIYSCHWLTSSRVHPVSVNNPRLPISRASRRLPRRCRCSDTQTHPLASFTLDFLIIDVVLFRVFFRHPVGATDHKIRITGSESAIRNIIDFFGNSNGFQTFTA